MKNLFRSIVFTVLAVATLAHSRPSHAAVAAVASAPLTAGLVIAGAGAAGATVSVIVASTTRRDSTAWAALGTFMVSLIVVSVGLIVLDGEQAFAYQELTPAQAAKLQLTETELMSFNAEIDQVNALAAHVSSELTTLSNPTIENSVDLWTSLKDAVTPETFSAMVKVTSQLYK